MSQIFLSAEWRNLLMVNYEIDPGLLIKYLPCKTELDSFNNIHYVSLVGFLFKDTRVHGMSFPFHKNFEEVNLRFYVRYKDRFEWKRGVVFIKEIVPRHIISFIANKIYGENYATHKMKHLWHHSGDQLIVEYQWKSGKEWDYIRAIASVNSTELIENSEEEFITEHFWGYTKINNKCSGVYEVNHPGWRIHKVHSYDIKCNAGQLYGEDFGIALNQTPRSVFLADGSPIKVMKGERIFE